MLTCFHSTLLKHQKEMQVEETSRKGIVLLLVQLALLGSLFCLGETCALTLDRMESCL